MRRPPQLAQTARPLHDSRHEALERAVVAANPQKAMDEQATPEEAAELAFDEAGQADPVGARGGRGEEGLQVLPDDPVQDRVGGSAWGVGSHGARPSGFRAVAATRPQDARTTSTPRSPRRRGATPAATERCAGPSPEPLAVTLDCGPVLAGRW
jgi:hypothetical protein